MRAALRQHLVHILDLARQNQLAGAVAARAVRPLMLRNAAVNPTMPMPMTPTNTTLDPRLVQQVVVIVVAVRRSDGVAVAAQAPVAEVAGAVVGDEGDAKHDGAGGDDPARGQEVEVDGLAVDGRRVVLVFVFVVPSPCDAEAAEEQAEGRHEDAPADAGGVEEVDAGLAVAGEEEEGDDAGWGG